MPRYDAEWIETMLQPELRGSPSAEDTLALLGPTPGQVVADVGCGPGFFTLPVARLVAPTGLVYAVDVEPSMLELVRSRANLERIDRIETRLGDRSRIPLDDAVADLTLCGLVLHDLEDRLSLARDLARVTKPTGRIAVTEWVVESRNRRWNRLSPEDVTALFSQAGRQVIDVRPLGTRQYLLVAQ